jgi:hypothetical protein
MVREKNPEVEGEVRRRARFQCQAVDHKKISLNQYAHIIPHSDGGKINLKNILWLCESCQRRFEAASKSSLIKEAAVKQLEKIRDRPVLDSLIDGVFDELLSLDKVPIVIVLGSVGFQALDYVFTEPLDSYRPSYLKFYRDENTLRLKGHLKDINGFTLIKFDGDEFHFNTGDAWDFERHARYLKITNRAKQIWIEIKQNPKLEVEIVGQIYAGSGIVGISKKNGIAFPQGGGIHNLTLAGGGQTGAGGILLPASPVPRPYGHVNPNVPT